MAQVLEELSREMDESQPFLSSARASERPLGSERVDVEDMEVEDVVHQPSGSTESAAGGGTQDVGSPTDLTAMEQEPLLLREEMDTEGLLAENNSNNNGNNNNSNNNPNAHGQPRSSLELDWDLDQGWMPKPARLHSGKTRFCASCCAPLQYTTMQSWDEYLQSEEYLKSLQENLYQDAFISGLICGDDTGGDLPTEHRMHKSRKMKCRQSVHNYLNMTSAGVLDNSGKEKSSIRVLEEMLIQSLPTPVFVHVLERRFAVISHSTSIACNLMKESRSKKKTRDSAPAVPNVELHHLAIHTLSALLASFDYQNPQSLQSFEEISRLLVCFPALSLFSFWSPPPRNPEKSLPLKAAMLEVSSTVTNPRSHPIDMVLDESDDTFWQSQQRPGVVHLSVRVRDFANVSSVVIKWHQKNYPQNLVIECRQDKSGAFHQVVEVQANPSLPERIAVRFPSACAELRLAMSGVPPANRNACFAISSLGLNTPVKSEIFSDPKATLNDVANWLADGVTHHNEDVAVEAFGALKAWALATGSLNSVLLFITVLIKLGAQYSHVSGPSFASFCMEEAFNLHETLRAHREQLEHRLLKSDNRKRGNESRKIRAVFESSMCSSGVTIEEGGLTVRTRETSYQYAAVNFGISHSKASWRFRLDNDTADDEMTCFGAAILPVTVSGYDSSPNLWMLRGYNGNLYARGHKLSRSIGKVHPGDTVQIDVDMQEGTMAYKINDTDYGVVFTDLIGQEVYPAVSFYGSGKVITLLSIHKWEDCDSNSSIVDPVYLSSLKEYHHSVGYGTFGKGNVLGYASDSESRATSAAASSNLIAGLNTIQIAGEVRQRSLSTHPPQRGEAFVMYDIAEAYERLIGGVAINDDVQNEVLHQRGVSLIFSIWGDGCLLWQSKPVVEVRKVESFELDVRKVRMLVLRVMCSGSNHLAHAIWIDPCLYPLKEWKCNECLNLNKGLQKICTLCGIGMRDRATETMEADGCNEEEKVRNVGSTTCEFSRDSVLQNPFPFYQAGLMTLHELNRLCQLTNMHVMRCARVDGVNVSQRGNAQNSKPTWVTECCGGDLGSFCDRYQVHFEEPYSLQPCKEVFEALLRMLQNFRHRVIGRLDCENDSSWRSLMRSLCVNALGVISANLSSVDRFDVPTVEAELSANVLPSLRNELEDIVRLKNAESSYLSREPQEDEDIIEIAAAETIVIGFFVLYKKPQDKTLLLLALLRRYVVSPFPASSAKYFLLCSLMQLLSMPGRSGIVSLMPLCDDDVSGKVEDAEEHNETVKEIMRLIMTILFSQPSSLESVPTMNSSLAKQCSIVVEALSLLRTYQLLLLSEAVELTKTSAPSGPSDKTPDEQSQLVKKRVLIQNATLEYSFLLLTFSRELFEKKALAQAQQAFLLADSSHFHRQVVLDRAAFDIVPVSSVLPWFVACLCLLRRQTWLARPILPSLTRLLSSVDHYCSDLQVLSRSEARLRKLEMRSKARQLETQECENWSWVASSEKESGSRTESAMKRRTSKQLYNVFKQLYTGTKDHFEGQIGFQFEATSSFAVMALGRSVNPTKNNGRLVREHVVRLWEESSQHLIAQVTISNAAQRDSLGYAFEKLSIPVRITQGKLYRLTTQEFANGGDPWYKKENLPDEQYDTSYIKILRDCYVSGSNAFPSSQNLTGAAYGVPTFLVEGENLIDLIPRFMPPEGSLPLRLDVRAKSKSLTISHSGRSAHVIGDTDLWRSCFFQTLLVHGVHSIDFIVKSARVGGVVSGHVCVGMQYGESVVRAEYCDTFLGALSGTIGWMPSIAMLWVNGKHVKYGTELTLISGDILTLTVDYDHHIISFAYNGRSMGVAYGPNEFDPATCGGEGELEAIRPGASIYGIHDVVQIRPSGLANSTLRIHWLLDLLNSLSSLGGRVASTLIAGHPVDCLEEELLPWLQSQLFSGGILPAHASERRESQLSWSEALRIEFAKNPPLANCELAVGPNNLFADSLRSNRREVDGTGDHSVSHSESEMEVDDFARTREFLQALSVDFSDDGAASVLLKWLDKALPDQSFLKRLGSFPDCERKVLASLIRHAPPHVIHEVQAIITSSNDLDTLSLVPSEDMGRVWKVILTLRHWLIQTRQQYRAKQINGSNEEAERTTSESNDSRDVLNQRLSLPRGFDELLQQLCERAEFLCTLDPPSEDRSRLSIDSQLALSNLAEKWSTNKTPPSLQPMLERWKSLREADSSKWSGVVNVLRAQHRWRTRHSAPSRSQSSDKSADDSDSMDEATETAAMVDASNNFAAMLKACDLYIRHGIGAPPDILRSLLDRRQKRSDSRVFGLQAMKNLLTSASFDTVRHNALIFLRPALRGFTDDEKESREHNDGVMIAETFRATVRHHYLKGLEGCNRPTIDRVQRAFYELYLCLVHLLNPATGGLLLDCQLKQAILCAWSLDFEPRDHAFLLRSGILTILHELFSLKTVRQQAEESLDSLVEISNETNDVETKLSVSTNLSWHALSEQFVHHALLSSGFIAKRDVLQLLLQAPRYVCTGKWWNEKVKVRPGSKLVEVISHHSASSLVLMYSELLQRLEKKVSMSQSSLTNRKVLQFGMRSSCSGASSRASNSQSKADEISFAETPPLGQVNDFTIEMWIYPVELSGYRSLRSDNGFGEGSVYVELVDQHVQIAVNGNNPREQRFDTVNFRTFEWAHLAVVYQPSQKRVMLFVNGRFVSTKSYTSVCSNVHLRAARMGCWVNDIDAQGATVANVSAQRCFKGSIAEVRVWNISRSHFEIWRDFERSVPFDASEHGGSKEMTGLMALWHLDEGEGVCGHDASRAANVNTTTAIPKFNARISGCHWAALRVPTMHCDAINNVSNAEWCRFRHGIRKLQQRMRFRVCQTLTTSIATSKRLCEYEDARICAATIEDEDIDESDDTVDTRMRSLQRWNVSTDERIIHQKQTRRCAWVVFRFLAVTGICDIHERREAEAIVASASAKQKRKKQKAIRNSDLSEDRAIAMTVPSSSRLQVRIQSLDEEDSFVKHAEAASDAAKTAASDPMLEEPALQTLWFSLEFQRKVFEIIENELVLATTLAEESEGLTRAQRMIRSISSPIKTRKNFRSRSSLHQGVVKHHARNRRGNVTAGSSTGILEPLELEMYLFNLLSFMCSQSDNYSALLHLARPQTLCELLHLLRLGSPRCQRVVKLLLRRVCQRGIVQPVHIKEILGSESVLIDLLLDQVSESVSNTIPSRHSDNTSTSETLSLNESFCSPLGFRSGQIYLTLASESVALLRLLLHDRHWRRRVLDVLSATIRSISPLLHRKTASCMVGDATTLSRSDISDFRVRAAITRAVSALCVLGSHPDCIRVGGKVEVTTLTDNAAGANPIDYGFSFGHAVISGPSYATVIELCEQTCTARVAFDGSESDPVHNVQEVALHSIRPVEEVPPRLDLAELSHELIPTILQLGSLHEYDLLVEHDDLWYIQIRSRALLALESFLRHAGRISTNTVESVFSSSLLQAALAPINLKSFVSLPFLQEGGRMIMSRLIEASSPLGRAMFHGLGEPQALILAADETIQETEPDQSKPAREEEEESEEMRTRRGFASTLAAMGFEFGLCMAALEHARNDPNLAVEWLMGTGAAAYQERQHTERLNTARHNSNGRQAHHDEALLTDGSSAELDAKTNELMSVSGMPRCVATRALELFGGDPNRAMDWLMEHGNNYLEHNRLEVFEDTFQTVTKLLLDDSAALEDAESADPLVASSSKALTPAMNGNDSQRENDNAFHMAMTLAPVVARVNKPSTGASANEWAPLDPEYLTPFVVLTVSDSIGSIPGMSAGGRTGVFRRYSKQDGVLITFLNTETGAYEDEWHAPVHVRRLTAIYDEPIEEVSSIYNVGLRMESALSTLYARRAVVALLNAWKANNLQSQQISHRSLLEAMGGPRQFVNLLKLIVASELSFVRKCEVDRPEHELSMHIEARKETARGKRVSLSLLQTIEKVTLDILQDEALSGRLQGADWQWLGLTKPTSTMKSEHVSTGQGRETGSHMCGATPSRVDDGTHVFKQALGRSDAFSATDGSDWMRDGASDDQLHHAIALSMQEMIPTTQLSEMVAEPPPPPPPPSSPRQSNDSDEEKNDEESPNSSLGPRLHRMRQPSYAEAQEVATQYLQGGVDDHDGLLSSVLVKECVSHFVESTRVASEGVNLTSASDTLDFESLHPYFGRCDYSRHVSTDGSYGSIRIIFDRRCALGPKATLTFYSDSSLQTKIVVLDASNTNKPSHPPSDVVIHSNQFWFRFASSQDVGVNGNGFYGYRFQVKPLPSINWLNENEVLRNPCLEWACWMLEFLLNDAKAMLSRGAVHNRKIYGALVRYLRSPGAPFKTRVVRLLMQLLHQPELFQGDELPDLDPVFSIGELAIARAEKERANGESFISSHLLQLVELLMVATTTNKYINRTKDKRCTDNVPELPMPLETRRISDVLDDTMALTQFLLGENDSLPQQLLVEIWMEMYGACALIETSHPYTGDSKLKGQLRFDGAQAVVLSFDYRCATGEDSPLEVVTTTGRESSESRQHSLSELRSVHLYGGNRSWPSGPVELLGDHVEYSFTGHSNAELLYGVSMSITALGFPKEKQTERLTLNDIETIEQKLRRFQESTHWTSAMDAQLVDWVNNNIETSRASNVSSIGLKPHEVRLHHQLDGLRCSLLLELHMEWIQLRFALLKCFNQRLEHCLPFLDLREPSSKWTMAYKLRRLSHCIFFDIKFPIVEAAIEATAVIGETPNAAANSARITLDRLQALESRDDREVEPSVSECFFAQAFRQLQNVDPSVFRRKIDSKGRLFSVKFRGEEGVDWGGVYREGANSMVDDLFSPHFNLFVLCPNGQHDTGINRSMYLPNPKCTSPVAIQMFEFVGMLLGISLRTHADFPFSFPSLVWKQLINQPLDRKDLEDTDAMLMQMIDGIRNCERDGILTNEQFQDAFQGLSLRFTAFDCNGTEVELVDRGKSIQVTFDNRKEYCHLVEAYRLAEGKVQVAAMARGLGTVYPLRVLTLLTWQEMEMLTCGSPKIDIALWKQHTRYDGYNENDETVKLFWEVMGSFTDEQRSDFVRFAWGRSRLPRGKWPQPFKLTKKGGRDSTLSLPVAHTCFFSVELPPYTSREKMRNMLLATINFGLGGILMA